MKREVITILFIFSLSFTIISCHTDSTDQIIREVEREYEKEYGSDLIMHREWETYKGLEIFRFSGWTVKQERKYTEINSDEWIIIFCADKQYQIIKHAAFLPMDSVANKFEIKCFSDSNYKKEINRL